MSSESSDADAEKDVDTLYEVVSLESSEDPPMEEWSSLETIQEQQNPKKLLYEEGLYDPGLPDICSRYIAQSTSSVTRHVYYRYPAIVDPGIIKDLFNPPDEILYDDNGQDLYLAICKEMNICVVGCFHRGLLSKEINLSYYGVNPYAVRAMALALAYNSFVEVIRFNENFLNTDACYHFGQMLATNKSIKELDLSGCRIGHEGVKHLLTNMIKNNTLKILNLSGNEIGDEGMEHFGNAVFNGLNIKRVNLSRNGITGKGVSLLVEPFQVYNKITHWDLSYNNLFSPGTYGFLMAIAETTTDVVDMNLSWNSLSGLRIGQALKKLLTVRNLKHLDLSNNKLQGEAIKEISSGLSAAKKLVSLNLSYNPMDLEDALVILKQLKFQKVRVSSVYLENVTVDKKFLSGLEEVMRVKPHMNIKYGYVKGNFKVEGPDKRELLFKRMAYLCQRQKKNKFNIQLYLLQLQKDKVTAIASKEFFDLLRRSGAPLDNDLVDEMAALFPGPRVGRAAVTVDINALVEYSTRKYPDEKLPPTPPPEPPVMKIPAPVERSAKKKDKKKR